MVFERMSLLSCSDRRVKERSLRTPKVVIKLSLNQTTDQEKNALKNQQKINPGEISLTLYCDNGLLHIYIA